jgi:hypothetical protein
MAFAATNRLIENKLKEICCENGAPKTFIMVGRMSPYPFRESCVVLETNQAPTTRGRLQSLLCLATNETWWYFLRSLTDPMI